MSELMCSQSKCRRKDEHIAELKAELADTVTECLAAKSNEDIMRKQLAELQSKGQELAEFKQTARRLVTDTHNKWAIDRLIILAGERDE